MFSRMAKFFVPALLVALVAGIVLSAAPAAQAATNTVHHQPALTAAHPAYVVADWRDHDRDGQRWRNGRRWDDHTYRANDSNNWNWRERERWERERIERERLARERWEREHRTWSRDHRWDRDRR